MSKRTTINIPTDVMRMITHIKRSRPKASTNELLIELARIGGEKHFMVTLIDAVDRVSDVLESAESIDKSAGSSEKLATVSDDLSQFVLRNLCIARRFAHKVDADLLKTAEKDALKLLEREKASGS